MSRYRGLLGVVVVAALGASAAAVPWWSVLEKRVAVVVPGRVVRGAWQEPGPLGRILAREKIRTIVSLAAVRPEDPKYVSQARVVGRSGVRWVQIPIHGSHASLDQMGEAADLLADPANQPVFFHCIAGHHRSSQAHAAYLIRHRGYSAEGAWAAVSALPWARPDAPSDAEDRRLIFAFADREQARRSAANANARPGGEPWRTAQAPPPSTPRR